MANDTSKFPDPTYQETVLAPLFDGVKTHFAADMMQINHAHLVMLQRCGILPGGAAGKLARALVEISAEAAPETLKYTGEHEDYFFVVEAQLQARLGDLAGALHTARSRNDMDHSLFRRALLRQATALQTLLHEVVEVLLEKAGAERDTLIVAYTHGQPAQPSTFGHYLAGVAESLLRDAGRLEAAIAALDFCPMGAAAITTTGFPIDRHLTAELLGFAAPCENSYLSIAGVDYITGLYSAVKLIFVHLGRVTQDFAFWAAFEVGQLYVPNALVQISSIMPQKRNPVPIEHMRHLASLSAGRCDMVVNTMHNTPFTDMNDSEGEVQAAGFAAFESGGRMLRLFGAFVPGCEIRTARVAQNTAAACITITELADSLVRTAGVHFRAAHDIAASTSRAVIEQGVPVQAGYAAFQAACLEVAGRRDLLSSGEFAAALDPCEFVRRRDRFGGPAPAPLNAALKTSAAALAVCKNAAQKRAERKAAATTALNAAFSDLQEM